MCEHELFYLLPDEHMVIVARERGRWEVSVENMTGRDDCLLVCVEHVELSVALDMALEAWNAQWA